VTVKCPKCQSENTDTARFCSNCATPLPESGKVSYTKTLVTFVQELTRGILFAERYEIIEALGKGGMGEVYRAEDKKTGEELALKLIKPEISADAKTIERFSNELKLAHKISHRNVCRMFHLSEEKGTSYITMEYVPGEDLKSFLKRSRRLDIGTAISISKQVCEGMAEAHGLGVVHRDLKPSNIMIDKDGNARIMDFGIARSLKTKGITGAGVMIGTPEYMSPEQVEAKEVDQRSDIYSLGVILYEMVTGRIPFQGETSLSIAMKQKSEMPKDPKEFNAQIPEDLSQAIMRCLEKDKENRYQSAEELLSELTDIEKGVLKTERMVPKKAPREVIDSIAVTAKEESDLARSRRIDPEACRLCLKGNFLLNSLSEEGYRRAVECYQQALEIEPDYAALFVGLAMAYTELGSWHMSSPEKEMPLKAKQAAMRALELDDMLAEAHFALGRVKFLFEWDWPATDRLYKKGIELNPSSSFARITYANFLTAMGRVSESISITKQTIEIDPLLPINYNELGWALQIAGKYDDALEQYQRALKLDPEFHQTHWALAYTYFEKGMYEEAITHCQKLMSLAGEVPFYAAFPGYIYGMTDRRSEALEILDSLKERSKKEYISSAIALIHIGLAEKDQAIEWLERAYREHDIWLVWLKMGSTFDTLRDDPRFQDLLRLMNFLE